jgi:L-alanine-DL-glutamate epimerase-like enolase superfamily enzyme
MATTARAVLIQLTLDDGRIAQGESVPVEYVTGETVDTVLAVAERVAPALIGLDASHYRPLWDAIGCLAPHAPSARCGLEMAALDAWSQGTGISLHQLLGGALNSVESDLTLPLVPNAAELAAQAWARGISVFKIKVGGEVAAEVARVHSIRAAAPEARLRIDANQAFTPEGALAFVERLLADNVRIELLEQPVRAEDFAGLGWVAERSPVPVFADESARTPADALRLTCETPVQGINCKINKNGIAGVLDIVAITKAAGRRRMLGCMLETRRSISVSLEIACGTGAFEFVDLDSHLLLNETGDHPFFQQEGSRLIL